MEPTMANFLSIKTALLMIAGVCQLGDVLTTNRFLAMGQHEGNPVMAWLQAATGDWWIIPKLLVVTVVLAVVGRARTAKPALFLAGLGLLTVLNNLLCIGAGG